MALVFLVIIVTNICAAYIIVRILGARVNKRTTVDTTKTIDKQPAKAIPSAPNQIMPKVNSDQASESSQPTETSQPAALNLADAVTQPVASSTKPISVQTKASTWAGAEVDCRAQLHTLLERLRYARAAEDKRLVKDVVSQLQANVKSWQAMAKSYAQNGSPVTNCDAAGDDHSTDPLEIGIMQLQTTLSNAASIDWSSDLTDIVRRLDHEIRSLGAFVDLLRQMSTNARQTQLA